MPKKTILLVILTVLLIALVLTRCRGEKKQQELFTQHDSAQTVQTGTDEKTKSHVQKLGTVTGAENGGIKIETEQDGEPVSYSFSDISIDDWCVQAINFAVTNGLMTGMDNGSGSMRFRPDHGVTREQLAMILYSFTDAEPAASTYEFDDVKESDWYRDCVCWAAAEGYIAPSSEESFGVGEFCSCEEVLTVLHRVAGSPSSSMPLEDYPYAAKVSENALTATRWAWEKGLIAEDECVWYPTQAVSRAQIALLLMRYDAVS